MKEEYGSMLSTANSSATSSASSSKRIDFSDLSLSPIQQSYKESMPHEARVCSGHCKAIVQGIVEEVRAETEQWSQMQEMLGQVRDEMEELQASRDFWEDRALDSDYQIQSLQSAVKEWRQKALSSEAKANELQEQISVLNEEIERLRKERERKIVRARNRSPINQEAQNETEKRILVCHLKENRCANDDGCNQKELVRDGRRKTQTCTAGLLPRRSPLREIGNISALMKQHGEGILPLFCLHKEEMKRSF
ncbi:Myosin-related isoform 3 [Theobroma cacao]|nr:Myosin-related isoform 3 [Theobroma cacao]